MTIPAQNRIVTVRGEAKSDWPAPPSSLLPAADVASADFEIEGSDRQKLARAFTYFNDLSRQLTHAYANLEQQVKDLSGQLARAEQRHESEVAARERVAGRLAGLMNTLPVGVVLLDVRGFVQESNPAAIEFLGEPLLGERWLDIINRAFSPRLDDGHEVSLRDGRRVSIATRSLQGEPGQLIVLTDMTETRELQERLSHHQRLSALGKMVASLAHQIRTPLSAAMIYGDHLLNPDLTKSQQQRFASKVMSRLNHLEQQVRDMLIFAKTDLPLADRITTDVLMQSIRQAMEAPLAESMSRVSMSNQAQGICLQCNKDALVGAVLNLVNNAIQAVGSHAEIELTMQRDSADSVSLTVRDSGPGIDETVQAKILEPFFTTKSHGTGLGLAVVQAVSRAHQGDLRIESHAGSGTRVEMVLPTVTLEPVAEDLV